ncbi:MAG: serine/threonine protein kinase [Gemmatimonadaceae bacterium]|nr:serine/threonine protein kinase [Gemmatimonadaceae bacterium]
MTDLLRARLDTALHDRFAITRELGGGGMSRVFVASERALGRDVVIKALPDDVVATLSADRFEREIRLLASLQQANIVPVLASGTAAGTPWYTMPFVAGESLRQRLAQGPLTEREATAVLRDVARALAYAHDHGIIHRDIKPDNILLSGDAAVVTDFGIAKAVNVARAPEDGAANATLTSAGISLGTPAYMAPEQVLGDTNVDARADLYALGCVAFELVTGRPPFTGNSTDVVRAHLSSPPPALSSTGVAVSAPYAALVARLLAKSPNDRPASARDVARTLDDVHGGGAAAAPLSLARALGGWVAAALTAYVLARAAVVGIGLPEWTVPLTMIMVGLGLPAVLATWWVQHAARRASLRTPQHTPGGTVTHGTMASIALRAEPVVTWRRTRRAGWWAMGGVASVVALTMILRQFGIGPAASLRGSGRVSDDARVIVAEFTSSTGDTTLGEALTQAMRSALGTSRAIRVMRPAEVGQVLRQMARDPATPLTTTVSRELAQRAGAPLVVTGRVAAAGSGFLVTVELITSDSGQVLATFQRGANGPDDLLAAMDRVARDLRARMGESLRDVARTPALASVTTASLPALRAYSRGLQLGDVQGDFGGGLVALREAVQLDSTFASAWRKAAAYSFNMGEKRSIAFDYSRAAYRYRERLVGEEREQVEAYYVQQIGVRQAVALYHQMAEPQNNEAVNLHRLGDFAGAEAVAKRMLAQDSAAGRPHTVQGFINVVLAQGDGGKVAEARASLKQGRALFGNVYYVRLIGGALAWNTGGLDSLDAFVRAETPTAAGALRADIAGMTAALAGTRGELSAFARAADAAPQFGSGIANSGNAVDLAVWRIVTTAVHTRSEARGLAQLDSLASAQPTQGIAPIDRRDAAIAAAYAQLGKPDRAAALLESYRRLLAREERLAVWGDLRMADGEIALARGKAADAIPAFRSAAGDDSGSVEPAWTGKTGMQLARAFDRAGQLDSAMAYYRQMTTRARSFSYGEAPLMLPIALRRMGELYEARGDISAAIRSYREFVALWKNADPVLQPQVAEVRARIARLEAREGGRR